MRLGALRVMRAIQLPLLPEPESVLDRRDRGTSFHRLASRSVLNPPASTRMGFWSINPYVGCEFGCSYCYARDTHRWVVERAAARIEVEAVVAPPELAELTELAPLDAFERKIFVKTRAAEVLRRTLDPARIGAVPIVIGSATDPYQPAERQFRLTRQLLEALLPHQGLTIGIITKSALVVRDLALLQQLAARHRLRINFSLASMDPALIRKLEPRTPLPMVRLQALARLTDAGLEAGLLLAPILPGITDGWASLARVMEAARAAGAHFVSGIPLRLGPSARERFLEVLRREFPQLAPRYQEHFEGRTNASRSYRHALARRIRLLKEVHGFPVASAPGGSGVRQRNEAPSPGPRRSASRPARLNRPANPAA